MPGDRSISLSATCSTACWSAPSRCLRPAFPKARRPRRSSPLAFTIGSWVLDFALAGQPGALEWVVAPVADADAAHLRAGTSVDRSSARRRGRDRAALPRWPRCGCIPACRCAPSSCVRSPASPSPRSCSPRPRRSGHRWTSPRIGATRFLPPISARSPSFASRCSSPFTWRRRTRATSICAATFWPSSSARFHDVTIRLATTGQSVVGSSSDEAYGEIEYSYARPRRQEPLDQPARNPAAALRAGGKAGSAAGRRRGVSGLSAGRRRDGSRCRGSSAASRC